jgi:flavin reductase (DIM6/NTAB) family NADH-FMN oxidoreductase RutF
VALLSAATKEKRDVMTCGCMFVAEDQPFFIVSVAKHIFSHDLIEAAGEFAINVASEGQADLARRVGALHGQEIDKYQKLAIQTEDRGPGKAPFIKGSFASIACKVLTSYPVGKYTVYIAEATDFTVDSKQRPVAWYGDRYFVLKDEARY